MIYSNRVNLTKLYCLIIPVLPIMGMYGFSELPFLTFSDYLLMICYILWGVYALNKKKAQCRGIFLPLVVYLLLHPMILASYAASDIDWVDAIGTSWRLAFYVFPLCILSPYHLDKHLLIKSFRFIDKFCLCDCTILFWYLFKYFIKSLFTFSSYFKRRNRKAAIRMD